MIIAMDEHQHVKDFFGDERRDPLILDSDYTLNGRHQGSICVHAGATFSLAGTQNGTVTLRPGSSLIVQGTLNGSTSVGAGSSVEVLGVLSGTVHVDEGGKVVVERTGRLAGTLSVDGLVQNEGIRGGAVTGSGEILDVNGGRVNHPIIENGMQVYRW